MDPVLPKLPHAPPLTAVLPLHLDAAAVVLRPTECVQKNRTSRPVYWLPRD